MTRFNEIFPVVFAAGILKCEYNCIGYFEKHGKSFEWLSAESCKKVFNSQSNKTKINLNIKKFPGVLK